MSSTKTVEVRDKEVATPLRALKEHDRQQTGEELEAIIFKTEKTIFMRGLEKLEGADFKLFAIYVGNSMSIKSLKSFLQNPNKKICLGGVFAFERRMKYRKNVSEAFCCQLKDPWERTSDTVILLSLLGDKEAVIQKHVSQILIKIPEYTEIALKNAIKNNFLDKLVIKALLEETGDVFDELRVEALLGKTIPLLKSIAATGITMNKTTHVHNILQKLSPSAYMEDLLITDILEEFT